MKLNNISKINEPNNYQNKDRIINGINDSLEFYNRSLSASLGNDSEQTGENLYSAFTKIYSVCEWTLRHGLQKKYRALFDDNTITSKDYLERMRQLNGKNSKKDTLYTLIEKVKSEYVHQVKNSDLNFLKNLSNKKNNQLKHNGVIPTVSNYLKLHKIVRELIVVLVDENALTRIYKYSDLYITTPDQEFDKHFGRMDYNFNYILILDSSELDIETEILKNIFNFKFDLIIDFNTKSDFNGLAKIYNDTLGLSLNICTLEKSNVNKELSYIQTPYWLFANGFSDRPESIANDKSWMGMYGRNLNAFITKFQAAYSKHLKIVFATDIQNKKAVHRIVEDFNAEYDSGNNVDVILLQDADNIYRYIEDDSSLINATFNEFISYILRSNGDSLFWTTGEKYVVSESGNSLISNDLYTRLSENCELVYKDIELFEQDDLIKSDPYQFYTANIEISWYLLSKSFDLTREEYGLYQRKINKFLSERGRKIYFIDYFPGVGGSTFMRRLAWDFHRLSPTLLLNKYHKDHTTKALTALYKITRLTLLIFIDGNLISESDANELNTALKAEGYSFIILFFRRVYSKAMNINSLGKIDYLKVPSEALLLKKMLSTYSLDKDAEKELIRLCNSKISSVEHSPFVFSLYSFQEEFKGVSSYVLNFFNHLSDNEKDILTYVSLADQANRAIPIEFFNNIYNQAKVIDNERMAPLLTVFKNKCSGEYVKIKHTLFATEILKKVSYGQNVIRFENLTQYIHRFIESSRPNKYSESHNILDLLHAMFITRKVDADANKASFGILIEKIKEKCENNFEVIGLTLNKLIEIYPEQVHFIAHQARYYFYLDRNYVKGQEVIDRALDMSKANDKFDPILLHIKAMGYSAEISNIIIPAIKKEKRRNFNYSDTFDMLLLKTQMAEKIFSEVQSCNTGIAGYISHINLCKNIVDLGKFLKDCHDSKEFIAKYKNSIYIEFIDKACQLIEQCRRFADEDDLKEFKLAESFVVEMVDNITNTIQMWKQYLLSAENKSTVRRFISRAYLNKNEINEHDYLEIINLMEENINEEPTNTSNIRIWFNAIREIKTISPEVNIDQALTKLNKWHSLSDSVETLYYIFVLKFLKTLQGSSTAESELKRTLEDLKRKSYNLPNRTKVYDWISSDGEGLEQLIKSSDLPKFETEEFSLASHLRVFEGRIASTFVNAYHAYINIFGIDVFFNPSATNEKIDDTFTNRKVKFALGFSFDGLRAYNSSIHFDGNAVEIVKVVPISLGDKVKCEVVSYKEYYVIVNIISHNTFGSIHVDELEKPFNKMNKPPIGNIFYAKILYEKYDAKIDKKRWALTMSIT